MSGPSKRSGQPVLPGELENLLAYVEQLRQQVEEFQKAIEADALVLKDELHALPAHSANGATIPSAYQRLADTGEVRPEHAVAADGHSQTTVPRARVGMWTRT